MTDEADEIDVPDFIDAIVCLMMDNGFSRRQAKAIVSDMIDDVWLSMETLEPLSPYLQ